MQAITATARAKINLTLHVGRVLSEGRFKGYHPVDSLVVFADFGDTLSFSQTETSTFKITGEFSEGLNADADNLVTQALEACGAGPQSVELTKNIPVSAGLGGGSANAAAVLRCFDKQRRIDTAAMGADIPVCRASRTSLMQGIGEDVTAVEGLGQIHAVLVNPRLSVSTGAIFKAFDSVPRDVKPLENKPLGTLLERTKAGRNDLQPIAEARAPNIADVLRSIAVTDACDLARMSGSGATCFGLYPSKQTATLAAQKIKQEHPKWWVKPCKLGDPS